MEPFQVKCCIGMDRDFKLMIVHYDKDDTMTTAPNDSTDALIPGIAVSSPANKCQSTSGLGE